MLRTRWTVLADLVLLAALGLPATAGSAPDTRLSARVQAALEHAPRGLQLVWVFFEDKPQTEPETPLGSRALVRRALRGSFSASQRFEDRPVSSGYVAAVARLGRVRHVSRWFNAASAELGADELRTLAAQSFVERIDLVGRYRRSAEPVQALVPESTSSGSRPESGVALDYGTSLNQLEQMQVPAVHAMGLDGTGVIVALFDAGFDNLAHEAFATTQILARHDFVNNDDDVGDGTDRGEGSHGTATLSVIGGFKEGQLVGPAYRATYLLAKTEDTFSETPVEEDNWAAAAEWAEAQGADVISSSLGYLDYDAPFTSLTWADMNGQKAISTLAAEKAAERGVLVVVSAGNAGFNSEHNTLGAPADGVHVLTVGAVDPFGRRTSFSSVGPSADLRIKPDVAAQGQFVKAAGSSLVNAYANVDGTSFSCPLTAGVVALLLQAHPTYTVEQVLALMRSTASQAAAPDNLLGWGIVNAAAALQARTP